MPTLTDGPVHLAASTMELPAMPLSPQQILGGSPEANGIVMWKPKDDSLLRNGVWEHTPGKSDYHQEPDELCVFVFFAGRATVTPVGHDPFEVKAGDLIWLPEGTTTIWDVTETVRAFYWVHQ
jgi:uncharacterized protein